MGDKRRTDRSAERMNRETKMDDGRMAAVKKAEAAAKASQEKLTPRDAELLAEVLAAHPTLTADEALAELRAAGM
jgi:hypothetical protein